MIHTNTKPGDRVLIGPKGSANPPLSDVVSMVDDNHVYTKHGMMFRRSDGREETLTMGEVATLIAVRPADHRDHAYATPAPPEAGETIDD